MGNQKLKRSFWQWLKVGVVVISFPVLVMAGVYSFFAKFPGSYSSEARIQIRDMKDPATDKDSRDYALKIRINELVENMNSTKAMSLLSYRLAIHDLEEPPFHSLAELRQTYPEEMLEFGLKAFKEKRAKLELNLSGASLDTMLAHMLTMLEYDPGRLGRIIAVRRIPASDMISIRARSDQSEMATFMVNEYAQEFIRYHEVVGKERLRKSMDFLEQMLDQKRNELEDKTDRLNTQRELIRNRREESGLADILNKIQKLEVSRQLEEDRIQILKASLLRQKKNSKASLIIHASNTFVKVKDDRDIMVELGTAMARKQFLDQQIEQLRGKVILTEETLLAPYKEEVDLARQAYLEVLGKLKVTGDYAENLEGSLSQITWGKSRFPYERAPLVLAILAALAASFLWYAFLLNLGFL